MVLPAILAGGGGYALIAVGTFFEGETVMLGAGVAASLGLLSLPLAIGAGMAGILGSDTLCFAIGRLARRYWVEPAVSGQAPGRAGRLLLPLAERLAGRLPGLRRRVAEAFRVIQRHDERLIVFFQFFPGLCTIAPIAFGLTPIPVLRFMGLDLLGNAAWTLAFAFAGYLFGTTASRCINEAHPWVAGVVLVGILAGAVSGIRCVRRLARQSGPVAE